MHTLFQLRKNLKKSAHFYLLWLSHKKFVKLEHTWVNILYNEEFCIWYFIFECLELIWLSNLALQRTWFPMCTSKGCLQKSLPNISAQEEFLIHFLITVPYPIIGNKVTNCKLQIFSFLHKRFHKNNIIKQNNLYLKKFFWY
jgi:hypothetical protein